MVKLKLIPVILPILVVSSFNYCHVDGFAIQSKSTPIQNLFHSGSEYLDDAQKYLLSWYINDAQNTVYFNVTVATTGFVGFGISPSGGMNGADILIAGVDSDGSVYSEDYHGVGNTRPIEDSYQNWNVTYGWETETHTILHFNRLLNTCDDEDLEITDGTTHVIWSFGETDEISYHNSNRGTKSVNFYLQDEAEFDSDRFNKLDMVVTMTMPSEHTAYWCTIHRAPIFPEKQHIIAFESVRENAAALQHTHHFILRRCLAPQGRDPEELFEPWVGHPGDYCYGPRNYSFPFLQYCSQDAIYVWSKGGKRLVFPEDLGLPMPEKLGQREYFALDIHYDNPHELEGVEFTTGARMYYTNELRPTEIGMLRINQEVLPQLTIPPLSPDFIVAGHCSGECMERFLPTEGVTVFNNLLHAHLAGRKLKLRHFRGEVELPWLDNEEYYDFDFQQNKPLVNYRQVERGDQLTVECTYDTRGAEGGKAVLGGLGTREEMCEAIVYYYPRVDFTFCGSFQDLEKHFGLLGMTKYEEKESEIAGSLEYQILEPAHLAGDYRDSVSFKVNWTRAFREHFQEVKRYGEQIGFCRGLYSSYEGVVEYPDNLNVYVPPDECEGVTQPPPVTETTTTRPPSDFEEWMKENVGLIQAQLQKLQESVDYLSRNETLGDKTPL